MDLVDNQRKTKCRNKYCVKDCYFRMDKNPELSFHALTKSRIMITRVNLFGKIENVDKRNEWLRKLNIQDCNNNLIVCSKQFKPEDCLAGYDITNKVPRLLKNAVSSLIDQSENCKRKEAVNILRNERWAQRDLTKESLKKNSESGPFVLKF